MTTANSFTTHGNYDAGSGSGDDDVLFKAGSVVNNVYFVPYLRDAS